MSLLKMKKMNSTVLHDKAIPSIRVTQISLDIGRMRKRDEKRVSKSLKRPMAEPVVDQAGARRPKTAELRAGGSALGPRL